jgi:hypothetical protein
MKTLNNIWDGEVAFIIGGGPSVMKTSLTLIRERCVIGVNEAFFLGDWVDVCWFGDLKWFRWNKRRLLQEIRPIAHCCNNTGALKYKMLFSYKRRHEGFCGEKDYNRVGWNGCSGNSAINFAYHLGSRKIVLIGFDMKVVGKAKNYHKKHDENYCRENPSKKQEMDEKTAMEKYAEYKRAFNRRVVPAQGKFGFEIINCTPGSALNEVPVISLEEYLRNE